MRFIEIADLSAEVNDVPKEFWSDFWEGYSPLTDESVNQFLEAGEPC